MKTKFLSVLALTAILFASCSSDDNDTPEVNDGRVKFSSGINTATTKVGGDKGDQWDSGDAIGIYMVGHTDQQIKENAENINYNAQMTGPATSFSSTTPIYYPVDASQKVDFIAYHPFNALVNNYEYPVNLSDQTNQSKIDLMIAQTTTGYDKTNTSAINLGFNHQLAKVIIKVSAGDGVDNLVGLSVTIKGMNTTAKSDIFNYGIFSDEGNIGGITPYNQPSTYNYEAILLPVALDAFHIVEFSLGGNIYKWVMQDNSANINILNKGNQYTFDVTLMKNKVSVAGSITPWINDNSGGTAQ